MDDHSKQLGKEAADWLYYLLFGVVMGGLILASVWGHAAVSAGLQP